MAQSKEATNIGGGTKFACKNLRFFFHNSVIQEQRKERTFEENELTRERGNARKEAEIDWEDDILGECTVHSSAHITFLFPTLSAWYKLFEIIKTQT